MVKLPQEWAPDGDIASLEPMLQKVAKRYLGGTQRIVSLVFFLNHTAAVHGGSIVVTARVEIPSTKHRFGSDEIRVFPRGNGLLQKRLYETWIRLASLFGIHLIPLEPNEESHRYEINLAMRRRDA
jgi:hypothetical protein